MKDPERALKIFIETPLNNDLVPSSLIIFLAQ